MSQGFLTPNQVVRLVQRSILMIVFFILLTLALSALVLGCLAIYHELLDPAVVHFDYLWILPWISAISLWVFCAFWVERTDEGKRTEPSWFDVSFMFTECIIVGLALWLIGPGLVVLAGSSLIVTVGAIIMGIFGIIALLFLFGG